MTTTACPESLDKDLRTLAMFIRIYCKHQHADREKKGVHLKAFDVKAIVGKELELCDDCTKLLAHAWIKRSHCPMNPKPMCKHCPNHCYHPTYRQQIREAMKFAGKKMVMSGRVDMLLHLLF